MAPTRRRGGARDLLRWMFVGRRPGKPPGRIRVASVLLAFVVWCFSVAFAWGTMPPLLTLAFFSLLVGAVMGTLGDLASYHRWRGDRPGDFLRLGSGLLSGSFVVLLLAHLVLTGQRAWLWWAAFVLVLSTAVVVAGHYYGTDEGPFPEDGPPEGSDRSK